MIQILSVALLLLQGGPQHADLHPAEVDAFLELGDLGQVLPALETSPVLRFLRDERLKKLVAGTGQNADRPLAEWLELGLTAAAPALRPETWLKGLKTVSASVQAVAPSDASAPSYALFLVAEFASAEHAEALRGALLQQARAHEPLSSAIPGAKRLDLGAGAPVSWCAVSGTRVVMGGGSSTAEDFARRAKKEASALSGNEAFRAQLAGLGAGTGRSLCWISLAHPLSEVMARSSPAGTPGAQFLDEVPSAMNPFANPWVARVQLLGERFVTEVFSSTKEATAGRPIDPAWLEPVPAEAMLVFSTAFDGAEAGRRMRELLARDETGRASLAAIEAKLGFGPERVLARLGPGLTYYAHPLKGIGLPESRLWIDCEDPAGFQADFEALVTALGDTLPGFKAATKPYKLKAAGREDKIEVPVTTLTLPPSAVQIPMISLSPSFAPAGKKLVFALASMDVKNELKRFHGAEGTPIVSGAKPLAAMGFELPADARFVLVMDWAKLLAGALDAFKSFAGMMGPGDLPFDPATLPPSEIFAQYFRPTFHYTKPASGGSYRRNEASFGPETWLSIALSVAAQRGAMAGAEQAIPAAAIEEGPQDGR
jgi:hypothetical protein